MSPRIAPHATVTVRAQKPGKLFRIGYLNAAIPGVLPVEQRAIAAFIMGLAERGLVQDRDFVIEYRYGDNRSYRLAEVSAEHVDLKVDVLVTVGTLAPLALKRATSTIPIVLTSGGDPVGSGLVDSLARPGGNVTGLSLMVPDIGGKRLEMLQELLPAMRRVAVIWNAANPYPALVLKNIEAAARPIGIYVQSMEIRSLDDLTNMMEKPDSIVLDATCNPATLANPRTSRRLARAGGPDRNGVIPSAFSPGTLRPRPTEQPVRAAGRKQGGAANHCQDFGGAGHGDQDRKGGDRGRGQDDPARQLPDRAFRNPRPGCRPNRKIRYRSG
jgi:hypothetical protein